MTLAAVYAELRTACDLAGSQKAWADRHGISPAYVNDVLMARRDPGEKILSALKFQKIVTYRKSNR